MGSAQPGVVAVINRRGQRRPQQRGQDARRWPYVLAYTGITVVGMGVALIFWVTNRSDWNSAAFYSVFLTLVIFVIGLMLTHGQQQLAERQGRLQEATANLELSEKVTVIAARTNWLKGRLTATAPTSSVNGSNVESDEFRGELCTKHDCKEISYLLGDCRSALYLFGLANQGQQIEFAQALNHALQLLNRSANVLRYDHAERASLEILAVKLKRSIDEHFHPRGYYRNSDEVRQLAKRLTRQWEESTPPQRSLQGSPPHLVQEVPGGERDGPAQAPR
jgi:hypothetical protein